MEASELPWHHQGRHLSYPSSTSSASAAVALLRVPCVRRLPSPTLDPGGPAAGMRTSLTKSTSGLTFSMKARSSLRLESTLDSSEFAFHTTMVLGSSGGTSSSSVVFWRLVSLVAPPGREKNCAMLIGGDEDRARELRQTWLCGGRTTATTKDGSRGASLKTPLL